MNKLPKKIYNSLSEVEKWKVWRIRQLENHHNNLTSELMKNINDPELNNQLDDTESELQDLYQVF